MILKRLLGHIDVATFLDEHFTRLPFSLPGGAAEFTDRLDWPTLEAILAQPEADVLVVRQGERWKEQRSPAPEEARPLVEEGYTLLVRHAERHDERLRELAEDFRRDFAAPVDVHIYCTPTGEHGFGWHYDAEDVFILQTEGRKEYSLRKNTVNPWPLAETLPADMRFERELMPVMKCLLAAGDWLYIPNGYWHVAAAQETALSLAVGVMTPSGIAVLDVLRERLLSSLRWRERLPVLGEASPLSRDELEERCRSLFAELGDDLAAAMRDEAFLRIALRTLRRNG